MIKHGKVHQMIGNKTPHSHLDPIKKYITKGIADARQKIVLEPKACDVRGAKKHNGQQCVIAKAFSRTYKPEAVAVGRSLAFAVFDGLAIRFALPRESRKVVEEFDSNGRVKKAPIRLDPPCKAWRLRARPAKKLVEPATTAKAKRHRIRKIGVRAVGGGIAR